MEILILLVGTAFIAVIGIAIGMLLAPRLDRWAQSRSEDAQRDPPRGDDDRH